VTITVRDHVAKWVEGCAAERNTSVSALTGTLIEAGMRRVDAYWKAYEDWKKVGPIKGIDAANRLTRDEAHERKR
jgi:hypothetical protein